MPGQVVARALLVLAVLLAQQTALAHDLWHAAQGQASAPAQKSGKLCELHDLLGTVLGAVSAAKPATPLLSLSEPGFVVAALPARQIRPLAPQSRGPPPGS